MLRADTFQAPGAPASGSLQDTGGRARTPGQEGPAQPRSAQGEHGQRHNLSARGLRGAVRAPTCSATGPSEGLAPAPGKSQHAGSRLAGRRGKAGYRPCWAPQYRAALRGTPPVPSLPRPHRAPPRPRGARAPYRPAQPPCARAAPRPRLPPLCRAGGCAPRPLPGPRPPTERSRARPSAAEPSRTQWSPLAAEGGGEQRGTAAPGPARGEPVRA